MADWYKRYSNTATDPKWRTIARISGQEVSRVVAIWDYLLEDANEDDNDRGRTTANAEDIASAFDLRTEDVEAVLTAMQGRVLDGDMILNWHKRQSEGTSTQRVREYRDRKKRAETAGNVTSVSCNALERDGTPETADKIREDKKREEEDSPQPPSRGAEASEVDPPPGYEPGDGLPTIPPGLLKAIQAAYERILVPHRWERFGGWYPKLTNFVRSSIAEDPARAGPDFWENHFNRIRGSTFPNKPEFESRDIVWALNPNTVGDISNGRWQSGGQSKTRGGSLEGAADFLDSLAPGNDEDEVVDVDDE